jgi:hypothetical protein
MEKLFNNNYSLRKKQEEDRLFVLAIVDYFVYKQYIGIIPITSRTSTGPGEKSFGSTRDHPGVNRQCGVQTAGHAGQN